MTRSHCSFRVNGGFTGIRTYLRTIVTLQNVTPLPPVQTYVKFTLVERIMIIDWFFVRTNRIPMFALLPHFDCSFGFRNFMTLIHQVTLKNYLPHVHMCFIFIIRIPKALTSASSSLITTASTRTRNTM